jgi:hypothetical protein
MPALAATCSVVMVVLSGMRMSCQEILEDSGEQLSLLEKCLKTIPQRTHSVVASSLLNWHLGQMIMYPPHLPLAKVSVHFLPERQIAS